MRKTVMTGSVCCLLLIFAEVGKAQVVRRGRSGGVRVRAPFVRVEVGPDGRTHVRAPFTSLFEPGFRDRGRYYDGPDGHFAEEGVRPGQEPNVAQMDWWELRQYTLTAATHLEIELAQLEGAAGWRATLRPGTIRDLIAQDSDQPPDRATVEHLRAILESYDAVDREGNEPITQLSGFFAVRRALVELTLPPRERLQRDLAMHWSALRRDLGRFETGASWQSFLELPPVAIAGYEDFGASEPSLELKEPALELKDPDTRQLEKTLSRYERVNRTEKYRAIARLDSFQATREILSIYMDLLREADLDLDRPQPRPRELPAPAPQP